jgi:hypothetical protein
MVVSDISLVGWLLSNSDTASALKLYDAVFAIDDNRCSFYGLRGISFLKTTRPGVF